jgi:hypothetical protein
VTGDALPRLLVLDDVRLLMAIRERTRQDAATLASLLDPQVVPADDTLGGVLGAPT